MIWQARSMQHRQSRQSVRMNRIWVQILCSTMACYLCSWASQSRRRRLSNTSSFLIRAGWHWLKRMSINRCNLKTVRTLYWSKKRLYKSQRLASLKHRSKSKKLLVKNSSKRFRERNITIRSYSEISRKSSTRSLMNSAWAKYRL